jgi:hypothetical protein
LFIVGAIFTTIFYTKKEQKNTAKIEDVALGIFNKKQACSSPPRFLQQLGIKQPVVIDLSQQRFKGIAFHHGKNMEKTYHPKEWGNLESFGTYALDEQGNIYLAPMPYISISENTFELQKNIYKLDSITGKIAIFMHLDDVLPSTNNPYGVYTLVYDCEDKTLWVATLDKTDYQHQKGVIYHIDIESKKILQRIEGFDALTLNILQTKKSKYLLAGSAKDSGLYAYTIDRGLLSSKPVKLFSLPNPNEHIRKIKIKADYLQLQAIPFSYTLVAQATKEYRVIYDAEWDNSLSQWTLSKSE